MSFWSCRKFIPQFYRRLTHTLNLVVQVFVCPSLERHVSDNRYVEALIPNPKSFPPYSTLKCLFIRQNSLSTTSPQHFNLRKKIIHCHCHSSFCTCRNSGGNTDILVVLSMLNGRSAVDSRYNSFDI